MTEAQSAAWQALWAANRAAEDAWADYDAALVRARAAEDAYWVARQQVDHEVNAAFAAQNDAYKNRGRRAS